MVGNPHLAQVIHRLVVQSGADDIKRCHGQHHHHAADHAGGQAHQPAVLGEHLEEPTHRCSSHTRILASLRLTKEILGSIKINFSRNYIQKKMLIKTDYIKNVSLVRLWIKALDPEEILPLL